ncbi:uncharacterized protein LOC129905093 [Episyrphus balteatus]|uniref:uncharacterized protein LOC129905093 n=1 Tax=Episyrphus balteatus TaxID=286459 RepID=UPI002484E718|nr:uncharacterized protein LOC129905093 [Episyrphus balteatus]
MTMRRLRNWVYILMAYRYQIKYRPTAKHANADALSRLPIGPDVSFDEQDNNLHKVNTLILEDLDTTPINAKVIRNLTMNDKLLNKVYSYIKKGWPVKLASNEKELKPFFEHYDRVIIPEALQSRALKYIHEGHWGCSRMKQLARRYIWFPDMDKQIEKLVANCVICQTSASNPKKDYVNWQPAENPWERIHLDFAGQFFNKMWLICVDSFSKFPFVVSLSSVTSESTIRALQMIFAIEGLPKTIVTDNVLTGDAKKSISGFTPSEMCYEAAIGLLQERYGSPEKLIDNHIQQLVILSSVRDRNDTSGLRNMELLSILLRCLPTELRIEYHRQDESSTNTEEALENMSDSASNLSQIGGGEVKDILRFLKREIESLEKSGVTHTSSKIKTVAQSTASSLVTVSATESACIFCKSNKHKTKDCDSNIPIADKRQILRSSSRCFRCAKLGHSSKKCRSGKFLLCNKCKGKHMSSLCDPN